MSLLRRAIDYLDRAYQQPLPTGHSPKDDLAISLTAWTAFLVVLAVFFGKSCSH
jgi:hypothetical protein